MDPISRPIDPADPDAGSQVEETGSLADFAAKYSGDLPTRSVASEDVDSGASDAPEVRQQPEVRGRHRSRSQQAKPDDQKAIAELTKRLRDAEAQVGVKIERQDGESERVYNLRRRAELAEAVAKRTHQPVAQPQPRQIEQPSAFAEKEPTIADFANDPSGDPYSAWQRALNRYDRRKDAFDAQQDTIKAGLTQQQTEAVAAKDRAYKTFNDRINTFKETTKDYDKVLKAAENMPTPPVLETALVVDPQGPNYIYQLAKNPLLLDELFMFTDGKQVTHETVAATQRLLKSRLQAAGTGSAASQTVVQFPPPPPNPVRTGRMRSGNETPPNPDDLSMDQFAQAFPGRKRR